MSSDSWRISVNEIDRSQTAITSVGSTGAMVIRSSRGPVVPQFINKNDQNRIINLFGQPSVSYPDVWEAIEFNKKGPMWISAPYDDTATLGGVYVSETGTTALGTGIDPATLDSYSFPSGEGYFLLLQKSPGTDNLAAKVTYDDSLNQFTVYLYKTSNGTTYTLINTYTVSTVVGAKDGFGKNIYVEDVFEYNDYIQALCNPLADPTASAGGFVDDTTSIAFSGGDRGSAITLTEITVGWNYFQSSRTYPADIFMDPTTLAGVVPLFETLRNSYQKYSSYLLPLPSGADATASLVAKDLLSVNNRGLAFYWNHGRVRDTYNNTSFWTSLIGRIGGKFADMKDIYNGGAPAWINENNHGGQLGSGIIELEYDPSEEDLQAMDAGGVNPIIFDPSFGVMIVSQKTAQTPTALSDTSWIAHSRLFDYIIKNVKEQVLTYQIVKLNDNFHRQLAYAKATSIVNPLVAASLLSEVAVQCDTGNNTDEILAARKFVLTVIVKVTPYSEQIVFNFLYIAQTNSVESYIE